MRVLIFHGYLLRGTGSNEYTAALTHALAAQGHEVHLLCQDLRAAELDLIDAVGRFDGDELAVETLREPVRVTAYLPDIGGTLPVYVADEYDGFEAVPFAELDDDRLEAYLAANVAAVREVARRAPPDAALANHLVMGPAILARALGGGYAVKVHGSALEYTVRPNRERFLPYAREGLEPAAAVLVGSNYTARSLLEVSPLPGLEDKLRLGPPGVDTAAFRPRPAAEARAMLEALADRLEREPAGWGGERGAAKALRALEPEEGPIVAYVGKLIVAKGVDLLIAAWPLVHAELPQARLCIVGFGTYRDALGELAAALGAGDIDVARALAADGRTREGGPPGELSRLAAFLADAGDGYLAAARTAVERIHFVGRLEHRDLPPVLCAAQSQVVPSTFPEAFGMVAVEAAACGALPVSAGHSGLAEVSAELAPALPPQRRPLLSFEPRERPVEAIAARLVEWLRLPDGERGRLRSSLSERARQGFGWESVAAGVIAAARGDLERLRDVTSA